MAGNLSHRGANSPRPAIGRSGPAVRSTRRNWIGGALKGLTGIILLASFWELLRSAEVLPRAAAPGLGGIIVALFHRIRDGSLAAAALETLHLWAVGLAVAVILGVPAGLMVGLHRLVDNATRVIVEFLRPVPSVALVPVAILAFGIGFQMKLFLVVFASFWPLFFNAKYGVSQTDPQLVEAAKALGFRTRRITLRVIMPSSLPSVATGFRVAATVALILAVISEMVAGSTGLGHYILTASMAGRSESMYAAVLLVGLLGYGIHIVTQYAYVALVPWAVDNRSSV